MAEAIESFATDMFSTNAFLISSSVIIGVVAVLAFNLFNSSKNSKSQKKTKKKSKLTTSSSKSSNQSDSDNESNETHSNSVNTESVLRGYKQTNDGRKTTYFHRELSDDEKILIGDCTPKRIDGNNPIDIDNSPKLLSVSSTGSAWNHAGTFEEKDISNWVKTRLKDLLKSIVIDGLSKDINDTSVKSFQIVIKSVKEISGDAIVMSARGKKKFIYDLSTEITWKLSATMLKDNKDRSINGQLAVSEISSDGDPEMSASYDDTDSVLLSLARKLIGSSSNKFGLQHRIKRECDRLLNEIKQNY